MKGDGMQLKINKILQHDHIIRVKPVFLVSTRLHCIHSKE